MGTSILDITLNHFLTIDEVKRFEEDGGNLFEIAEHSGRSALHNAAWLGRTDILQFFLDLGLNPNHVDKNGTTPLMELFSSPNFNVASLRILLEHDANLFAKDIDGKNALYYADNSKNRFFVYSRKAYELSEDLFFERRYKKENIVGQYVFLSDAENIKNSYVPRESLAKEKIISIINEIEIKLNDFNGDSKTFIVLEGFVLYMVEEFINKTSKYRGTPYALRSHKFEDLSEIHNLVSKNEFIDAIGKIMKHVYRRQWGFYLEIFHAAKAMFVSYGNELLEALPQAKDTMRSILFCIDELEKANRNFDRLSNQEKLEFSEMHAFIKIQ